MISETYRQARVPVRRRQTSLADSEQINHLEHQTLKTRIFSFRTWIHARLRMGGEQREQEQREREQREREQREREQREREQREREQREREYPKVEINFARWEDNMWKQMPSLSVDLRNPSMVEETIEAYMTQGVRAFNTKLLMMAPGAYFQAVINDRTHTILLVPQDNISIDNRMMESAAKLHEEVLKKVIGLKRRLQTIHPKLTTLEKCAEGQNWTRHNILGTQDSGWLLDMFCNFFQIRSDAALEVRDG
jgi:hypothetical protein